MVSALGDLIKLLSVAKKRLRASCSLVGTFSLSEFHNSRIFHPPSSSVQSLSRFSSIVFLLWTALMSAHGPCSRHAVHPLHARGCGGNKLLSWNSLKNCLSTLDIFASGFSGKRMDDVSLVTHRRIITSSWAWAFPEHTSILKNLWCVSGGGTMDSPTRRLPPNNISSFWSLLLYNVTHPALSL